MASGGKKKVLKKDDLRRLMKEKQSSSKTSSKTIDHPLAKYPFYVEKYSQKHDVSG